MTQSGHPVALEPMEFTVIHEGTNNPRRIVRIPTIFVKYELGEGPPPGELLRPIRIESAEHEAGQENDTPIIIHADLTSEFQG
jgi:hypothetical protein